jgi:hypothetical protein
MPNMNPLHLLVWLIVFIVLIVVVLDVAGQLH